MAFSFAHAHNLFKITLIGSILVSELFSLVYKRIYVSIRYVYDMYLTMVFSFDCI